MINYKQVVEDLQRLIPKEFDWKIRLDKHYMLDDIMGNYEVTVITLNNLGDNNKYRLYISELNECETDKDVLECCVECLREYLDDIKYVMVGMMNGCLIIMDEM